MSKNTPILPIEPNVLKWARESIGMSQDDFAKKLHKSIEDVESWEKGLSSPTYIQLENIAYNILKRPIAIFFLSEPPAEKNIAAEFRTLPNYDLNNLHSNTHLLIRKANFFQLCLQEVFQESKDDFSANFLVDQNLDPIVQAKKIRELLGISIEDQCSWKTDDFALKNWRAAIERKGAFVFKESFKEAGISGFCLYDDKFPIIYLNNTTTKTRQIFSLLHEFAHLTCHANGISKFDTQYINQLPIAEKKIEIFCNKLASEILIPSDDFLGAIRGIDFSSEDFPESIVSSLASRYSVSREAILRKIFDLGMVSKHFYETKSADWTNQIKKVSGGGDWYLSKNAYLSEKYASKVVSLKQQRRISTDQASIFLDVKPRNYSGLEAQILKGQSN